MAFDDSTVSDVQVARAGTRLHVRWASSGPAGAVYQVYVGGRLAWSGTERKVVLVAPSRGLAAIHVGAVDAGESAVDFGAGLPAVEDDRALIEWYGGTYLDSTGEDDVAGFRVYASASPGGSVDYTGPLATVAAYPGGVVMDGFGLGGFGLGGFGRAASAYSWTSGRLASGTWQFAVASLDGAGNETIGTPISATIATRPGPPAESAPGVRLAISYDPGTGVPTLSWLPSPG